MNKKQEIEKMEIDTGYLDYEFSKKLKDLGYDGMSLMLYIKDAHVGWYSKYITNEIIDKLENTTEESCVAALRPFVFNWFDEKTDWLISIQQVGKTEFGFTISFDEENVIKSFSYSNRKIAEETCLQELIKKYIK